MNALREPNHRLVFDTTREIMFEVDASMCTLGISTGRLIDVTGDLEYEMKFQYDRDLNDGFSIPVYALPLGDLTKDDFA